MVDADEAMKRAGKVFNGYSGRRPDDPRGVHVVRRILASLESSGWVCIKLTSELTLAVTECPSGAANCRVAKAIAAAPRLTGEKR